MPLQFKKWLVPVNAEAGNLPAHLIFVRGGVHLGKPEYDSW